MSPTDEQLMHAFYACDTSALERQPGESSGDHPRDAALGDSPPGAVRGRPRDPGTHLGSHDPEGAALRQPSGTEVRPEPGKSSSDKITLDVFLME